MKRRDFVGLTAATAASFMGTRNVSASGSGTGNPLGGVLKNQVLVGAATIELETPLAAHYDGQHAIVSSGSSAEVATVDNGELIPASGATQTTFSAGTPYVLIPEPVLRAERFGGFNNTAINRAIQEAAHFDEPLDVVLSPGEWTLDTLVDGYLASDCFIRMAQGVRILAHPEAKLIPIPTLNGHIVSMVRLANWFGGEIDVTTLGAAFTKACFYMAGTAGIDGNGGPYNMGSHQLTTISNVSMKGDPNNLTGYGVHLHARDNSAKIVGFTGSWLGIRCMKKAIYIQAEEPPDVTKGNYANLNTFHGLRMAKCERFIDIESNGDSPNNTTNNAFTDVKVQVSPLSVGDCVRIDGPFNYVQGAFVDTHNMPQHQGFFLTEKSSHCTLHISGVPGSRVERLGNGHTVVTSSPVPTQTAILPTYGVLPSFVGNQDDFLINAHERFTVTAEMGGPDSGNIASAFKADPDAVVKFISNGTPIIYKIDLGDAHKNWVHTWLQFNTPPESVTIEVDTGLLDNMGNVVWSTVLSTTSNIGNEIVANHDHVNGADTVHKLRITLSHSDTTKFTLVRIGAFKSNSVGTAWVSTSDDSIMYGELEVRKNLKISSSTLEGTWIKHVIRRKFTWDPGTIAAGGTASEVVDFEPESVGGLDNFIVTHTKMETHDLMISAHHYHNNKVNVVLFNPTGSSVTPGSGEMSIVVMRFDD